MAPRSTEANESIRGARREEILQCALEVFAERGFEGTRIQDIAQRRGLSYGLVYRYFPSKEAIFTTLVEEALESAGRLASSLPAGSGPEALVAFLGMALADPSPRYFTLVAQALSDRCVPEAVSRQARERVLEIISAISRVFGLADPDEARHRGEGIVALLLGTSIMRACGVSDGSFAGRVAAILARADGGGHGKR